MNERISSRQMILLITMCRTTSILTTMPAIYIQPSNQDIWIIIIISSFYTILFSSPLLFLANRFNYLTVIGYIEKIFGKVLGKIIGILYGMFFTALTVLFFYITVQMIRTSLLTSIKPLTTIFILMSCCTYFVSKGIGVIAKSSELFVPLILGVIILFILLGYNKVDFTILLPIYKDSTFIDINYGSMLLSYIFVDMHVLAMIVPYIEDKKDINKTFIKIIFYSAILAFMIAIVTQTSLGVEQAKHSNFPFLAFIRLINISDVFERIESIYIFMWITAMIIKITVYLYITSQAFAEVLKRKENNICLYTVSIIVALTTYYIAEFKPLLIEIGSTKPPQYIVYIVFKTGIPLIAVIVYFFRRKSLNKQEKLSS